MFRSVCPDIRLNVELPGGILGPPPIILDAQPAQHGHAGNKRTKGRPDSNNGAALIYQGGTE